jgi:hypothetical protein
MCQYIRKSYIMVHFNTLNIVFKADCYSQAQPDAINVNTTEPWDEIWAILKEDHTDYWNKLHDTQSHPELPLPA